jgi:hypothetical protein
MNAATGGKGGTSGPQDRVFFILEKVVVNMTIEIFRVSIFYLIDIEHENILVQRRKVHMINFC